MAGEWNAAPLTALAELSGGFAFKSGDYARSGRFILRTLNISDDCSINRDGAVYLPEELCPQYSRFELKAQDTLFVMVGATLGKIGFVREKDLPALLNQNMWLIRAMPETANPRFVHYAFRHAVKESLGWASGSARDFVRRDDYRSLKMPVPPLPEQRAIAHILGTLDDKIELNRRMNETLEAVAKAFFKSWFVDFDPVRAKAEGRDTGLPQPLADLFPDSFEDSELGDIPAGWGTKPLGALLSLDKGLSYKGQFLADTGVPMVNLGCFLGHGKFSEQAIKRYSGDFQSRHIIHPGDLLLANTDITQKREVLGSPALVPLRDDLSKLIFTHHVYAARFHESMEPWKLFVYFLLLQDGFRERATGFATGTTVLALPRDAVLDLLCPVAPRVLIEAFNSRVLPLVRRQWMSTEESRTLAPLRDTLLPKLISGELSIEDPDRFVHRYT